MRKITITLLLILLVSVIWQLKPLHSQTLNSENYVVTRYTMEEGLPQNSINQIVQSNDGYIWIATFSGLARFDGNTFTKFNRGNTQCLISDEILDIFIDSDNTIWLLPAQLNTIVTKFKDGHCETFKITDGIVSSFSIVEDHDGSIWVNTDEKSLRFNGVKFEHIQSIDDEKARTETIKSKEGVWFGIGKKLYRINNGVPVKIYDQLPGIDSNISYVRNHPVKNNTILIGTNSKVVEYEYGQGIIQSNVYPLRLNHFQDLKFDNFNNQFAITADGIAKLSGSVFEPFFPFKDQPDIRLKSILQDNEGNYWIGTDGDGLYRFKKKFISMIDKEDGLENEKLLSIIELHDGRKLFSTNCTGIYEWENGKAQLSSVHKYLPIGCYWSVFEDSKGRMWFGAGAPYMTEAYDKPGILFGEEQGFDGYAVFAITEDYKGHIWVANSRGIYIYDGTKLVRKITDEDGLYYTDSRVMYEDNDGTMWVGTNGGLHTIKNYKVTKVPLIMEFQTEFGVQPYIRAIHKDSEGVFWIGTYGDGLFRIKNNEVFHFTTEHGLYDNVASHIIEDENGFFWMGSNRGIHRISREGLNKVAEGESERVISYSYGSLDGMNSPETNGGFQPSYIVEENGDFYLPTVAGVAKVSVHDVEINHVPPPVFIERIKNSNGDNLGLDDIKLQYNEAFLEINFTAINFTDPEKVRFRYRLSGLNDNWVEAEFTREAIYTKIPPGKYTFQVIASNNDGIWNDQGDSISITIVPPFWQRVWFILLSVLLFSGGIVFVFLARTQRLRSEAERQKKFTERLIESQENERKRIAAELHDGLGQQILVIKNRVELAKLKFTEDPELSEQLEEIQHSALRSIEDVRNISHDLRPVLLEKFGLNDAVINLCEQVEKASTLDWSYHVDDIDNLFPKKKEINFYRILQEACNNILKHSNASQASLTIKKVDLSIFITIYDDGNGFDIAKMDHKISTGIGLIGMNERVETLNGKMLIQSNVEKGTTIKIQIPSEGHAG